MRLRGGSQEGELGCVWEGGPGGWPGRVAGAGVSEKSCAVLTELLITTVLGTSPALGLASFFPCP